MKTENKNIDFIQLEEKILKETFKELEFYTVLETVAKKCLTQKGRELITTALPVGAYCIRPDTVSTKNEGVSITPLQKELNQVDEMMLLMTSDEDLPIENISDVREILQKAKIEGAVLNTQEIMQIYDIVRVAREIKKFLSARTEKYPDLSDEISIIFDNPNLQKIILNTIDENGEIKDNATKELQRIRIEINNKSNSLRSKMNKIVRQFADQDMTQEEFYTVRDGRFVLPIKSEHKRQLTGIIHGVSQTGATVYIEPSEIIEMNNEISLLKSEEQREIYNILKNLTKEIAKDATHLIETYNIIGHIDSLHAKASYALQFGGIKPEIIDDSNVGAYCIRPTDCLGRMPYAPTNPQLNDRRGVLNTPYQNNEIIMNKVYHPILVQNLGKKNVVPLSINFSFDKRGHLISGPNAGGKTVALKSIGLNVILALSGFFPIGEVKMRLTNRFLNVFSAIGDHQSIENNLSTFSSQLLKMKEILDVADSNSLVLIDEICSGTDPREGGALAAGILDTFIDLNLFFIVTTHQSSLKTYALNSREKHNLTGRNTTSQGETQPHKEKHNLTRRNTTPQGEIPPFSGEIPPHKEKYHLTERNTTFFRRNTTSQGEIPPFSGEIPLKNSEISSQKGGISQEIAGQARNDGDWTGNDGEEIRKSGAIKVNDDVHSIQNSKFKIQNCGNSQEIAGQARNDGDLTGNDSKIKGNDGDTVIQNCSFEFDEVALQPTYNFLSGIPGNSYAFVLAKNVGLSDRVINRSKKYLGNRQKQLEKSISALQKFKKEAEEIVKEHRAEKLKYEGMKKDYENRKKEFIDKKKGLLDEAKLEANEILQKANALVERTIRELQEEKKSIAEVKANFKRQQKEIETEAKIIQIENNRSKNIKGHPANIEIAENLNPDDTVGMLDSPQIGIVLEADNDEKIALVEFNGIKFRLPFSQLYRRGVLHTPNKNSGHMQSVGHMQYAPTKLNLDVKTKLDLRGFRAEEAIEETKKFISQAMYGNADYVTIVHGKGTGVLQTVIHDLLKHTSTVKSFRFGEIYEGGSGATIAYLK